jgi:hypothetical protein
MGLSLHEIPPPRVIRILKDKAVTSADCSGSITRKRGLAARKDDQISCLRRATVRESAIAGRAKQKAIARFQLMFHTAFGKIETPVEYPDLLLLKGEG